MITLNQEQKQVLLRIYSTGVCTYQQIDFIDKAQSDSFDFDNFDRLKYVAELEELRETNPEKFFSPIESNPRVVLNPSQKEQIRQILKAGCISDEELDRMDWLPNFNPFEGLTYADELLLFGKMMGDYR